MASIIDLQPKTHRHIQEELHSIAEKHASRSELLHLLDDNPEQFPGQSLNEHTIESDGILPVEEADKVALEIEPRYSSLQRAYDAYCEPGSLTGERMQNIISAARVGQSVINGSDHAELVDIIFNHLHFSNRIRAAVDDKSEELGVKQSKNSIRSGLIVSKMIDYLGIEQYGEIVPVRDVLPLGFDKVYLTIPNAPSSSGSIETKARKRYNRGVKNEVASDLRPRSFSNRRPMILGAALPGTINKQAAEDTSTWVVGQANPAVIEFMQYALTVVSAVRMSSGNSQVFLDNQLDNIYSEPQLHAAMGRLITGLEMLDDLEYIYDEEGSTPVVEPGSSN